MIFKKCPRCEKFRFLTKHSLRGGHRPPFIKLCRKCHDNEHHMKPKTKLNKKYQPGTPKYKIKKNGRK